MKKTNVRSWAEDELNPPAGASSLTLNQRRRITVHTSSEQEMNPAAAVTAKLLSLCDCWRRRRDAGMNLFTYQTNQAVWGWAGHTGEGSLWGGEKHVFNIKASSRPKSRQNEGGQWCHTLVSVKTSCSWKKETGTELSSVNIKNSIQAGAFLFIPVKMIMMINERVCKRQVCGIWMI